MAQDDLLPLASLMQGDPNTTGLLPLAALQRQPSAAEQWQNAIEQQRQRALQAPSTGEQILGILGNTGRMAGQFGKGGLSEVLRNAGVQLPDWSNRISDVAQSEPFNAALGVVTPLKGTGIVPDMATSYHTPRVLYHETADWNGGDLVPLEARLGKKAAIEEFMRRWPLATRQQAQSDVGLVYTTDNATGRGQGGKVLAIDASKAPGLEWYMHPDEADGGWVTDRIPAEAVIGHADDPEVLAKIKAIEDQP